MTIACPMVRSLDRHWTADACRQTPHAEYRLSYLNYLAQQANPTQGEKQ
jgi:hypothetical protein